MKNLKFFTALVIVSSLMLTACSPSEEQITADPRGEYIYRVVETENGGFERYTDREINMHKYPEGTDFNTREEADKYVDKKNGGGYL